MALFLSRGVALTLMRNTLRISAAAARRGFSSRVNPLTTTKVLITPAINKMSLPLVQTSFYSSSNNTEPEADLSVADILDGVLHKTLLLIDVREPDEIKATGKIGRAINIPASEIEKAFSLSYADFEAKYHVTKPSVMSERIVIYCRTGQRDVDVCEKLRKLGYEKVKRYPGGIKEWNELTLGEFDVTDKELAK